MSENEMDTRFEVGVPVLTCRNLLVVCSCAAGQNFGMARIMPPATQAIGFRSTKRDWDQHCKIY